MGISRYEGARFGDFENLKTSPIEEVLENFHVTREQVQCVLDFAAKSTEASLEDLRSRMKFFSTRAFQQKLRLLIDGSNIVITV